MKYTIALIALILILFTLFPDKESQKMHTLTHNDTILAFGDSLTYGFGASANESYPAQLQQRTSLRVINAGVNGETSSEGLERLPSLLHDSSIKLMLLCMGGNDILQKQPLSQLKTNLKAMITLAKSKGVDVLLISVPDISLFGLSALPLYKEVAEEEEIPLLHGVFAEILSTPSLKSDQIHPNAQGYKQVAQKIEEALREHGWIQ